MRTRVKICGLTRAEDVEAACSAGADAIGLVFYPPSPRAVTIQQALNLVKAIPPFVSVTALFVNPSSDEVESVLSAIPAISLLQFHGEESADFCRRFGRAYIKAIPMREGVDLAYKAEEYAESLGLLVDTYKPGIPGGSGESFDWHLLPKHLSKPLILAGGLTCENVKSAVEQVHPYAVDVSGGVEFEKGIKDPLKIKSFMLSVAS